MANLKSILRSVKAFLGLAPAKRKKRPVRRKSRTKTAKRKGLPGKGTAKRRTTAKKKTVKQSKKKQSKKRPAKSAKKRPAKPAKTRSVKTAEKAGKKTKRSTGKTPKRVVKKALGRGVQPGTDVGLEKIGDVTHYFDRIRVIVLKVTAGSIRVGEEIVIRGSKTDFRQRVDSLQIESADVKAAKRGELAGLKVKKPARVGDGVYRKI